MNILSRILITIGLFIILLGGHPSTCAAIEDAIIAVVNDELITLRDLKDYIQSSYVGLVAEGLTDQEIESFMRDMEINGTIKLIEDKLILSKANQIGMMVREELIDERVEEVKENYGSEQKLIEVLIDKGATLSDLRQKIRDQLKIKFIIDHEVKSDIYVNPQEVTNYYEHHKDEFTVDERINLNSIFIGYRDNKEASLAKAVEAYTYAVGNNHFHEVAAKYSDTPSVGTVRRGQFLPEIENVVFNLSIEEISPMVEVVNGIYIFQLAGAIPSGVASINDVKGQIYDQLFNKKFRKAFMSWLDDLKKDAYIEIKE